MSKKETTQEVLRRCLACKKQSNKKLLLRFVCSSAGEVAFDVKGVANFRGTWVCAKNECLKQAVLKNGFSRAFSRQVKVDFNNLLIDVTKNLQTYILDIMGLAFSAGQCVAGRDMAMKEVLSHQALAVFLVSDLAQRSFEQIIKEVDAKKGNKPRILRGLSKELMGNALGRVQTGIVALRKGNISNRIVYELERLNHLMAIN